MSKTQRNVYHHSFLTLRPLYPWEKSPRYPLDRKLDGPQSAPGRFSDKKILLSLGIEPRLPGYVTHKPVAIIAELPCRPSGIKVVAVPLMMNAVFFDVTPCSSVVTYRRFGRACCLHLPCGSGGSTFFQNVGKLLPNCTASHSRGQNSIIVTTVTVVSHVSPDNMFTCYLYSGYRALMFFRLQCNLCSVHSVVPVQDISGPSIRINSGTLPNA